MHTHIYIHSYKHASTYYIHSYIHAYTHTNGLRSPMTITGPVM